jgi:hypothetical protein
MSPSERARRAVDGFVLAERRKLELARENGPDAVRSVAISRALFELAWPLLQTERSRRSRDAERAAVSALYVRAVLASRTKRSPSARSPLIFHPSQSAH